MDKNKFFRFCKILSFLLLISIATVNAQNGDSSTPVLKAQAAGEFKKGNFAEALEKYTVLLSRYPKDGMFSYYKGLCLYHLNRDYEQAASLLEFAVTRPNIPVDSYYHLGRIYMRSYRFRDAKMSFEKFLQAASKKEARLFDAGRQIDYASHSVELTRQYSFYEMAASSRFSFTDSEYLRQVFSSGVRLINKPQELMTPGEQSGELTNYMFMPEKLTAGDYIYIAGYGRNKKRGSDIFRVKYLDDNKWGSPEPVSVVNTSYYEILPYFDTESSKLYFASMGHNSMGGFDVFRSSYTADNNTWSTPENLGFPLNSMYDDFLVVPLTGLNSVLLVSTRHETDRIPNIYRLNKQETSQQLAGSGPKELMKAAGFGAAVPGLTASVDVVASLNNQPLKINNSSASVQEKSQTGPSGSYNDALKEALSWQFKADSTANLAKEARLRARNITDPATRWNLQKDIAEWEKLSEEYQLKADEYYRLVKKMESDKKTTPEQVAKTTPESVGKLQVADDQVKKQSYPLPDEAGKSQTTVRPNVTSSGVARPGTVPQQTAMQNRFAVLDKSPYSVNNPFPVNTPIPAGPYYSIQLAVLSQRANYSTFGGLSPIRAETIPDKNMTRYYTGNFDRYDDAVRALDTVKKNGFSDAFIVGWYNGQKMPPAKVREFEKKK